MQKVVISLEDFSQAVNDQRIKVRRRRAISARTL